MAWKHLTQGGTNYYVNLDEIAYLQQFDSATVIVFTARSDSGQMSITVEQTPHQILKDEVVS